MRRPVLLATAFLAASSVLAQPPGRATPSRFSAVVAEHFADP